MPTISHRRITAPPEIKGDGLGLADGQDWLVEDSIVDLSDWELDEIDECVGVTWGSSATFRRCHIKGAGKLFLCGCGDESKVPVESGKRVELIDCLLEDGGRRFPEAQDGMEVVMHGCLIRNWGAADRFSVRNFGAWAHKGGKIDAFKCVFWQDSFWRPLRQMWADFVDHIGQAFNDEGWRALLRPSTYLPGVCRGLFATNGGDAHAWGCWKNKWWIYLPWQKTTAHMDKIDAIITIAQLEKMAEKLDAELPKE